MTLSILEFALIVDVACLFGIFLGCFLAAIHEKRNESDRVHDHDLKLTIAFYDGRDLSEIERHELADPDLQAWEREISE